MFLTVLTNVIIILVYMMMGFLLSKAGKANASHAKTMSAVLLYILNPAMIINAFLQMEYDRKDFVNIGIFFVVTFVIQALFFALLYLIFSRKYDDAKYRILSVGSVLGNVGFFGMPVLCGIFPNDPIVVCYSSMNVMSMNLLVFTVGIFMITNDKKYMSLKSAIYNPTTIAIVVALILYVLDVPPTGPAAGSVNILGKMVTPMCMFIIGIRLSTIQPRVLFTRPFVYATCALKLIAFPVFAFLCVSCLPFLSGVAKAAVVVLAAAPSGVVIETLAELHECEQELSANVVLLTTIVSVITMPIVLSLLPI